MAPTDQSGFEGLTETLEEINATAPASAALFDYQTGQSWSFHGGRWFHAASTIKIAILACTCTTLQERGLSAGHHLLVRNRFVSAADGSPYHVLASRDSDADVHAAIGRTMPIGELARYMITVSSNLATNVLLDFIGVEHARRILAEAGMSGIDLLRGVEDDRAFDAGISNRVTADGLVGLLRAILDGRFGAGEHSEEMLDILAAQTFNSGIPAGLPPAIRAAARIAHKTGEISTVTHDAGLVFLPGRPPYVLAILTNTLEPANRYDPIARISARVFECVARDRA
jgi:beta-lactamase class A